MSSERTLVFVPVLAALALSCSGGEPTPPVVGTPAVTHLLDHRAHSIEVAGSGLPAAVEVALSDELVWMRGERLTDLDWFLDRSASTEGAEIAARATPRFTPAGPARLVTWGELDDPEAGHRPGTDDPPGLSRGTVLINARGLTSTILDHKELPTDARLSYQARSVDVRAHCLGVAPTVESLGGGPSLTLGSQTRRVLPAAAPSRLSWRVEVPAGGQLRLGYGLHPTLLRPEAGGGLRLLEEDQASVSELGRIGFWVSLVAEGEEQQRVLWSGSLAFDESGRFRDATVPLAEWAGQRVELTLATTQPMDSGEASVLPIWAEPVLDAPDPHGERPNVVLIVVDTLRADALGCYGNPRDVSPSIDDLAERGVRFADPMSAATWTLPSHASIMTSLYPPQHGLLNRERLPRSVETLADVMRTAGYQTLAVTEGIFLTPDFGLDQGFDLFDVNTWLIEETVGRALDHLNHVKGPTFLYWHTFQPHAPYDSVERFRKEFVRPYAGGLGLPVRNGDWHRLAREQGALSAEDMRYLRDLYDAEVAYVDEQVGRLLRGLRARQGGEHMLVVLTSDHGEAFDEHGVWGHGTSTHREQAQVPLILWQPGRFEGGLVAEHPVHTLDIAPTIAAAAGIDWPEQWQGELLSILPGPSERPLVCAFLTPRWQRRATALRAGSIKVMQNPSLEREVLFDPLADTVAHRVDVDPLEERDLWEELDRDRWLGAIDGFWESHGALTDAEGTRIDGALQQQLRDAGYVGD
ncbi:MAG TPA: sulfatase [Planctomycetota bacterium]|nr:sulfatase [Planctomycetota bacterium]